MRMKDDGGGTILSNQHLVFRLSKAVMRAMKKALLVALSLLVHNGCRDAGRGKLRFAAKRA